MRITLISFLLVNFNNSCFIFNIFHFINLRANKHTYTYDFCSYPTLRNLNIALRISKNVTYILIEPPFFQVGKNTCIVIVLSPSYMQTTQKC